MGICLVRTGASGDGEAKKKKQGRKQEEEKRNQGKNTPLADNERSGNFSEDDMIILGGIAETRRDIHKEAHMGEIDFTYLTFFPSLP